MAEFFGFEISRKKGKDEKLLPSFVAPKIGRAHV